MLERIILSATTPAQHHSLLIGARGMGKTHLVSLVYYRLDRHQELKDKLLVAWLREDEWGIDSWLDLVVRIFRSLEETNIDTKGLLAQLQQVSISDAVAEVLMRLCMEVKKYRGQWVELFVDFLRIWYRPAEQVRRIYF